MHSGYCCQEKAWWEAYCDILLWLDLQVTSGCPIRGFVLATPSATRRLAKNHHMIWSGNWESALLQASQNSTCQFKGCKRKLVQWLSDHIWTAKQWLTSDVWVDSSWCSFNLTNSQRPLISCIQRCDFGKMHLQEHSTSRLTGETHQHTAQHTQKVQRKLFLCFSYPSALDSIFNCSWFGWRMVTFAWTYCAWPNGLLCIVHVSTCGKKYPKIHMRPPEKAVSSMYAVKLHVLVV